MSVFDNPAYRKGAAYKRWLAKGNKPIEDKPAPAPTPKKKEPTAFEKLAARKGVDLPAEQARATAQLKAGEKVQGLAPSSQKGITAAKQAEAQQAQQTRAADDFAARQAEATRQDMEREAERQRVMAERARIDTPGGWKNVKDVLNLAFNPFAQGSITANVDNPLLKSGLSAVANHPYQTAFLVAGVASAVQAVTKISAAAKLGTIGALEKATEGYSLAQTYAVNTMTQKATASMLTKMVGTAVKVTAVVGGVMAMIGSYPFAGFIKEEALQQGGLSVKAALDIGDFEGAEEAMALTREILNPALWEKIKSAVPFVNVLNNLNDFYEAARIKLSIDEKVVAHMKNQIETGTDDATFYANLAEERAAAKEAERAADEAYYSNIAEQAAAAKEAARADDAAYYAGLAADKIAAAKATREAAAAYWEKILADREAADAEKRIADEDYWTQYYKELATFKSNSAPSKLNFGLL